MQNVLPCPCHGTKSSLGLTNEKINDRLVCYSVYLRDHKDEVVCCLSLQLIGLFVSVSGGSASCRSVLQISGDYCVLHFCRFAFKVWLFLAVPCGNMQRSVVGFGFSVTDAASREDKWGLYVHPCLNVITIQSFYWFIDYTTFNA